MAIGADRRLPALLFAACALVVGTAVAEFFRLPAAGLVIVTWCAVVLIVVRCVIVPRVGLLPILGCLLLLSAARWTMLRDTHDASSLKRMAMGENVIVQMRASVLSVPTESALPGSLLSGERDGEQWRTRFLAKCHAVRSGERWISLPGICRVSVDGRAAKRCGRGDRILMTGRLSWPETIGNPGEFDFATYLRRRQIDGLLFINHAHAIEIESAASVVSAGYWLTHARRRAQQIIERSVSTTHRALALALLLGDRSEVRPETETAFVSSGTMHLLAISGLHIGILCGLLIRILHCLLVPWRASLLLVVAICIVYAFVTDLRPSVVRATLFVSLFA